MSKLIVIVGITGNQGASVADVFLKESGWKIRGISRDPTKASSKIWSDKGIEVVKGDLDHVDTLKAAFKGANVIFGVTDFWTPIQNPANHEKAKERGVNINDILYEIEVQQGKNIVDAAYSTIDTLDRFVLSSLSHAKKWSGGKHTNNLHFDAKWAAVDYLKETYPDLWKKSSIVQIALFMQNWKEGGLMAPQKQPDGAYKLTLPVRPDSKLPFANPRRDTGHFVKALVEVEPGKNLAGAGSVHSWKEWAELFSKTKEVTCTYEDLPDGEMAKAIPGGLGAELEDMFRYMDNFGYFGGDDTVVYPSELGVKVPAQTLEEYFKEEDFSSLLK